MNDTTKRWECAECSKTYRNKYILDSHKKKTHNPTLECPVKECNKMFGYAAHLKRHLGTHNEKNELECSICHTKLKNESTLKLHLERIHGPKMKCPFDGCDALFKRNESLKNHIDRVHTGMMKFCCDIPGCAFQSNWKQSFDNHRKVHSDDRPFHCQFEGCTKAYITSNALLDHERIHKPPTFKCPHCDKLFYQKSFVKTHNKKIHLKEQRYRCNVDNCKASFYHEKELEYHNNVHLNKKPFLCPEEKCDYAATCPTIVYNHKKRAHSDSYIKTMKKKEQDFHDWLLKNGFDHLIREQRIEFKCREQDATWITIDFMIHRRSDDTIFLLELDENSHKGAYPVSCESLRPFKAVSALTEQLNGRPAVYCRLNPDAFKVDGETKRIYKVDRYKAFKHFYETLPSPDKPLSIQYMYYDVETIEDMDQKQLVLYNDPDFAADTKAVCLPPIY